MLNEVLQMISSNVKANVKQQQTKDLAVVPFFFFFKKVPSKLEIQCKKGVYFLFDFGWYSIQWLVFHSAYCLLRTVGWGVLFKGKNLLNVTKAIC